MAYTTRYCAWDEYHQAEEQAVGCERVNRACYNTFKKKVEASALEPCSGSSLQQRWMNNE
jgi:hypothetical protein